MTQVEAGSRPTSMVFGEQPVFDSVEEERAYRKLHLAAALRAFAMYGFDRGVAGHITVRDPEYPDRFWVNPYGTHFGHIRSSDLICVDHDGNIVAGEGLLNTAAFAIHSAIHKARPDVVAAAHAHSRYGSSWAAVGKPIEPITTESCFFFDDHVVYDSWSGVAVGEELTDDLARGLGGNRAAILKNHGILTVGESVDEAAWWFIALERCCETQFLVASAGGPSPMSKEEAERTHQLVGRPHVGWFSFQPLYQEIERSQPDIAD